MGVGIQVLEPLGTHISALSLAHGSLGKLTSPLALLYRFLTLIKHPFQILLDESSVYFKSHLTLRIIYPQSHTQAHNLLDSWKLSLTDANRFSDSEPYLELLPVNGSSRWLTQ